ncbi:hypothetical protein K4F52_005117 [Lecanicillium sp. MT-2017a]|nr:hypothetical protein K4F52_005117 [Lecanicillium sp. MT-2017a]
MSGIQLTLLYQKIGPRAAEKLHQRLTAAIFGFNQDITFVTRDLQRFFMLSLYLSNFTLLKSVIISIGVPYASPAAVIILALFYLIARNYIRISRQSRFHDIAAKVPLITQFAETASGFEHIRAYGWESLATAKAHRALDTSQKSFHHMFAIRTWLLLTLDILTLLHCLAVVAGAVYLEDRVSQAGFGCTLFLTIHLTHTLSNGTEAVVGIDTGLGAVSRIRDLERTTPQELPPENPAQIAESWPQEGQIVFDSVTARYDSIENTRPVLDNISIRICAGETVGVIGDTGSIISGKSSMLLALLNFLEYSGTIEIDGVDISRVPREVLRSRITTVSQEPVVLDGTVRDNLMPYEGQQNEPTLHEGLIDDVLGQVHLLDFVNEKGGVDKPYADMGFSGGQAQLLSIGRAMLHNMYRETKIILMDEPTSNVDNETDEIIRNLIRDEFIGYTVMVVSHRKDTILDADLFLEFSEGRIVKVTKKRKRELSMTPSSSGFSTFSSTYSSVM